ncbi:anaerobic ribonucleoside-triphosphate reductase [Oscillibacter sp. CAG:155]|nr:anaerobic ribonucleoside-triphosphate reductase [Oscillibacter sp. CAG:155]
MQLTHYILCARMLSIQNLLHMICESLREVGLEIMKVIKRNGTEVLFDLEKIIAAITKANDSVEENARMTPMQIQRIAEFVELSCLKMNRSPSVEEIQDLVEYQIMAHGAYEVAKNYVTYRYTRSLVRRSNTTDEKILSLIECCNEEAKQENSNKNPVVNSTQRDYMAGEVSRDLSERLLLPPDIVEAHKEGIIHFHDSDYYAQHMHNCDLVNLEDMLQNGTVITGTLIERPHSFSTACNIATQIIAQVASNQYGGQSISLAHLAPFVDVSRKKIRKIVEQEMATLGIQPSEEKIRELVETRLRDEVRRGVQTIQYQVLTLLTTNGQAPFVTVFMYLGEAKNDQERKDLALIIEETLEQRYQGVKNEDGVWITPAFPKLIYVLEEDNIHEDSPYYYLTKLAAKCTARRMVPDYISAKKMKELKGDVYTCMGCRSFLTPDRFTDAGVGNIANAGNYEPGKHKYYGRFNQGVVTINLPDVALSSGGDLEKFWSIFDERLELCHRALMCRHERLKGTLSDVAPILWQYGACARLKKGEPIDELLYHGYSTISLGYAGLYECVKYMTGKSHTDPEATPFALSIMQHMNDACKKWKEESDIDFSLYGTPLESTTYKFAKCLQRRFGIIEGITDKGYITNSYHVHVTEEINAFDKLKFEAQFQHLSPGGAISYVEVPDMQNNLEAVLQVMKFIYDNIIYAELNTKSDYCQVCGWDGEIQIVEENGKLIWKCPKCGNTDQDKMNVARRTCGYIGTQFWNQGRTQEIRDRVLHL